MGDHIDALRARQLDGRLLAVAVTEALAAKDVAALDALLAFPRSLTDALAAQAQGKGPADLLFASVDGQPLDNSNFTQRVLNKGWKSAGIERLTFHDLRHTAASLAVQAGGNVKTVLNMLGHASATMTLDTYAGLFDTDAQALADRMDEARERAISESSAHYLPTGPQNVIPLAVRS